jgi:uncharacterized protein YjbI with pentapeptide repeats
MTICSEEDCEIQACANDKKCILHCDKSKHLIDIEKPDFLQNFHEELIKHIRDIFFLRQAELGQAENEQLNRASFFAYLKNDRKYLDGKARMSILEFSEFLTNEIFVLEKIAFPGRDKRDYFDYLNTLKKLSNIHFDNCEFMATELNFKDTNCYYQNCIFHENWAIYDNPILENVDDVSYSHCKFHKYVSVYSEVNEKCVISNSLFNDCEFNSIDLWEADFEKPIFHNTEDVNIKIKKFKSRECIFHENFMLNGCIIEEFKLEDSAFKVKFEFKENKVGIFEVINTNYSGIVDTYKTTFKKFAIKKSIFDDFVGFESCEFGAENENGTEYISTFTYATFLSFVNFRNTTFKSGLDIEHINLKEYPNFLNASLTPTNTNRETFRIIKHSFDKIGNQLEANKFFVYEMNKYKAELKYSKLSQQKIIFYLNKYSSDFGNNYLWPIGWIFAFAFLFYGLQIGHKNNLLYKIYEPTNQIIAAISGFFNNGAKAVLPFSKFLEVNKGMEFVSLIFYIIFGILIWQTIVAVKRHTKR